MSLTLAALRLSIASSDKQDAFSSHKNKNTKSEHSNKKVRFLSESQATLVHRLTTVKARDREWRAPPFADLQLPQSPYVTVINVNDHRPRGFYVLGIKVLGPGRRRRWVIIMSGCDWSEYSMGFFLGLLPHFTGIMIEVIYLWSEHTGKMMSFGFHFFFVLHCVHASGSSL
jgi:hypothetical protein